MTINDICYCTICSLLILAVFFIIIYFFQLFLGLDTFINLLLDDNLRHTRNMSYDLRGDPEIIPRQEFVWNNPNRYPIYNPSI